MEIATQISPPNQPIGRLQNKNNKHLRKKPFNLYARKFWFTIGKSNRCTLRFLERRQWQGKAKRYRFFKFLVLCAFILKENASFFDIIGFVNAKQYCEAYADSFEALAVELLQSRPNKSFEIISVSPDDPGIRALNVRRQTNVGLDCRLSTKVRV